MKKEPKNPKIVENLQIRHKYEALHLLSTSCVVALFYELQDVF